MKESILPPVLLLVLALVALAVGIDRQLHASSRDKASPPNPQSPSSKPGKRSREKTASTVRKDKANDKPGRKSVAISQQKPGKPNRLPFSPAGEPQHFDDSSWKTAHGPYVRPEFQPMLKSRPASTALAVLPSGFQESVVFSGLVNPTAIEFASDGRVFVAEKSGLIKVFDNLSDTTPTIFADLRTNVHNFWDRGLLGLALHPNFPATPYVYVLYTFDAVIGGTAPRWGNVGGTSDGCDDPPGATSDGCVVSGRLSRLQAAGNVMTGSEQVFIEDWCQQFPSHSIGSLAFGADGALYVSGGEGASFSFGDYGQTGIPRNPCGDPPGGVGALLATPTSEGGALRSQDLRTSGDPVSLDGAILRVNPDTGAALPDNPLFSNSDPNARRIIAYGFRNPFRITMRPGTSEVWVGDVGQATWEEIDQLVNPTASVKNFGWPCYEGDDTHNAFDSNICTNLYQEQNTHVPPFFAYNHNELVVPGEPVPTGSSSISGLAFYNGGNYPAGYMGALFFADYSRKAIWVTQNIPPPASPPPPVTGGLVAAYNFNEGSGNSVADASGQGHTGTVSGAAWTTSGKYDKALTFDGVNDLVSVADSNLLDLTTGMTLEAWVNPTTSSGVRDIMIKEGSDVDIYNLYARNGSGNPESNVFVGGTNRMAIGSPLPLNTWTHVTGTYDGSTVRLFINGVQVASTAISGSLVPSTGSLRIGGNSLWTEFFQGRIDEVRIYNRALSASEIQTDMNTPVPPTTPPPPPPTTSTFLPDAAGPVQLKIGPGGDLFYVDFDGGTIRRITYNNGNQPPTAVILANPLSGAAPLTVNFDGTSSSDPDAGATLSYSWDLNGDGVFGDSTSPQPSFLYNSQGAYNVSLRVTDNGGASDTDTVLITVGNPPTAVIDTPQSTLTWKVGDVINFSGSATDPDQGPLPASALSWSLIMHHCPSNCHTHAVQDFIGVASGSFPAPDHEYPSYLELKLTATDASGLTDTKSVLLNPQTAVLTFQSNPSGLQMVVDSVTSVTPFNRTVILGSNNSIGASSPQTLGGQSYSFASWSDGGAQSHNITAGLPAATYTATYQSNVTAFPGATTILTGTLSSGNAAALVSDNNVYYAVNSTTTGTRTSDWYGTFTGVPKSLLNLRVNYKGNNTRNCTQTVSIWNWITSAWVQLDSRTVGTTEIAINNLIPPGTFADYVSGSSGSGDVRVKILNTTTANFTNRGDLMSITYDVLAGPPDTTPPVRSNGAPTGTLGAGTTQATLSLTTDESATCRYATTAGVAYGSMVNVFTTTGGTAHSTGVTGLTNGGSYNYFVRCQDVSGNPNTTDFTISFSVALDTTPPVRSNGAPTGTLGAGTTQATLSLTTDENATCRYATTAGVAYASMTNLFTTTGGTSHSTGVTGLTNGGSYNYFVRCQDVAGNPNTTDFTISFSVALDTTPPVRSNGAPTGTLAAGTTQATLSLTTDENASCRYATTAGVAYASMVNVFTTTGATAHSTTVTGLTNGGSYNYFVRCQDVAGNPNTTDFTISFSVAQPAQDTTPPVRSNGAPTGTLGAGTTQATLSLTTDENASCRYATTAGVAYASMVNVFTTTGATAHSTTVTGLTNGGSYNYFVRCQDVAGNPNTTDFTISFSVAQSPTAGLVAAYNFNLGSGTIAADASGNGHTGTISGPTWSALGKFGNALSFDGVNDWVTVNSTALLNLTTGMTLEAWVFPTTSSGTRDIMIKEGSSFDIYNLYARNDSGNPESNVFVSGSNRTAVGTQLPINTWTHVTGTYNGSTVRLFINGVEVANTAISGSITTSTGVLRIGGNSLWGEFFMGRIDEIRIYNRALTAAEIQADMAAPIN